VREWIAHLAYQRRFPASKNAHAIERLRRLFASALDYAMPASPPDFRIRRERFVETKVELPAEYLVFVHNASWKTKLWPERLGCSPREVQAGPGVALGKRAGGTSAASRDHRSGSVQAHLSKSAT
jgi:heptosyltransferase-1